MSMTTYVLVTQQRLYAHKRASHTSIIYHVDHNISIQRTYMHNGIDWRCWNYLIIFLLS